MSAAKRELKEHSQTIIDELIGALNRARESVGNDSHVFAMRLKVRAIRTQWLRLERILTAYLKECGVPPTKRKTGGRPRVELPMVMIQGELEDGVPKAKVARKYGVSVDTLDRRLKEATEAGTL